MKLIRMINKQYVMVMAEFHELLRGKGLSLCLFGGIFFGLSFVPPFGGRFGTMDFGGYRGVYNSAWLGASAAFLTGFILSLFGFFFVKESIARDERSGLGAIIGASPLSNITYLFSKFFYGVLMLSLIGLIVSVCSCIMQLIKGEDLLIKVSDYLYPFILITLPALAFSSACAVFFESLRPLRGGLGNVVYFFIWMLLSMATLKNTWLDLFGAKIVLPQIIEACRRTYPDYRGGYTLIGTIGHKGVFLWSGIRWSWPGLLARLAVAGLAVLVVVLASLFFDRFAHPYKVKRSPDEDTPQCNTRSAIKIPQRLNPIKVHHDRCNLLVMLLSEITVAVKGHRWWILFALVLAVTGATIPSGAAGRFLAALAVFSPVHILSRIGIQWRHRGISELVFSAPYALRRILNASFLVGAAILLFPASGLILRATLVGEYRMVLSYMVGSSFVSSLAIFLGSLSRNHTLFEVIYTILWYIGPAQGTPVLDFIGFTDDTPHLLMIYGVITILFYAFARVWRERCNPI
ncbi:MAG: hypothetical protein GX493_13450 [Firmicutes bacterium]|nr:hypothetical protein [Bacillota bacterium]